jgi:hypothetical protein
LKRYATKHNKIIQARFFSRMISIGFSWQKTGNWNRSMINRIDPVGRQTGLKGLETGFLLDIDKLP